MVDMVSFLDPPATVDVLRASNNDVNLVKTRTVHFARPKASSRFERINKTRSLVCSLKYHVTFF